MNLFRVMVQGKQHKRVIFFLTGWQNKLWMYWILTKILARRGYCTVTYEYTPRVLSPNTTQTAEYLTTIADDIIQRIAHLKQEGYHSISLFGISLGTLLALMVANRSEDVTSVILSTTGVDIAEAIWSWENVHPSFKKSLLTQHYTLAKLQASWRTITPKHNIDHLARKRMLVYLSQNDELIPYHLGKALLNEFEKRNYDYQVIVNHRNRHVFTGIWSLVHMNVYLAFLEKKGKSSSLFRKREFSYTQKRK